MTVCMILENAEQTAEHTEQVVDHVNRSGPVPPDGARLVFGGPAERGWRMISVWDSQETLDRFVAERLAPAYADAGLSLRTARRTVFEVRKLIAGDLTGTPQPA